MGPRSRTKGSSTEEQSACVKRRDHPRETSESMFRRAAVPAAVAYHRCWGVCRNISR